jgi:hypothetical protein
MADSDFKRSYPLRTVCEITREIADFITILKSEGILLDVHYNTILNLLKEQMRYQKKMDSKLKSYKSEYEKEIYKLNKNFVEDEKRRSAL